MAAGAVLVLIAGIAILAVIFRGTVSTASGDVRNAGGFLDETARNWHAGLPKQGGFSTDEDSGCYFLVNRDTKIAQNTVACGPILRPDRQETQIWDLIDFTQEGDGTAKAGASSTAAQALPAEVFTAGPNGRAEEVDAHGLPKPEYARLTADSVLAPGTFTVADADLQDPLPLPEDPRLAGLGRNIGLASLRPVSKATVPSIPGFAQAAQGQKLYVLEFGPTPKTNHLSGNQSLTLTVGKEPTSLEGAPGERVLFSADGPKAVLSLDIAGEVQTINLADATRTTTPRTEPLYSVDYPLTMSPGTEITFPRMDAHGADYRVTLTATSTTVTPYRNGWAPPGSVFMTTHLESSGSTTSTTDVLYSLDLSTSTVDGGELLDTEQTTNGSADLSMRVPDSPQATVQLRPVLKAQAGDEVFDVVFETRPLTVATR